MNFLILLKGKWDQKIKNYWSKLNNALHFTELQNLRAGILPASIIAQHQKLYHFMTLFYCFFPVWEMLSVTQVITNAIVFASIAQFSICRWVVQN